MKILTLIISSLTFINICHAQQFVEMEMHQIDYRHNIAPSFQSKLIQSAMCLFRMKENMERKVMKNSFKNGPAKIPRSLLNNYNVIENEQNGRKVWAISPINNESDIVILYLHGGSYMRNIALPHWLLIEQLIRRTKATVVIPDYPLAPQANCIETYSFIKTLYLNLATNNPTKRIVFMGDSAGGGLAIGFAQYLKTENIKQPDEIIVFSPWLDVSMSNPDIEKLDKEDKILSIRGLKNAGKKYAGDLDVKDYRVSPIYGNFSGINRISIFIGTNDLLYADCQKLKQLLRNHNNSFNYFEYPDMFHDWVIVKGLKESQDVMLKVSEIFNDI
ncbi:MAG: alpha/beta hydrolase [Bacteroidales bacterium]|nr:alpha/beta hydrolase [Bacteroidales bacterium]